MASRHNVQHLSKPSTLRMAPFRCPEPSCTRAFNRKYTLAEHVKTHSGEKPYVCPVRSCNKRFTTTGNLSRHRRLHGPVLPLQCPAPDCGCTFASEIKLAKHTKFHLGTAEHVCLVPGCGKTFSTTGNHNRHMRNQHNIYHDICDDTSATMYDSPVKTDRTTSGANCAPCGSTIRTQSPNGADDDAWLFGWTSIDDDDDDGNNDAYTSESENGLDAVGAVHATNMGDTDESAWFTSVGEMVEPLTFDKAMQPWEPEALKLLSQLLRLDEDDSSSGHT